MFELAVKLKYIHETKLFATFLSIRGSFFKSRDTVTVPLFSVKYLPRIFCTSRKFIKVTRAIFDRYKLQ